jgi:uncharacterized protein YrrD
MKNHQLLAVSATALMVGLYAPAAFAADTQTPKSDKSVLEQMQDDATEAYDRASDAIGKAFDDTKEETNQAAQDLKQETEEHVDPLLKAEVFSTNAPNALSGEKVTAAPVYDFNGKRIGQVSDVVIQANGQSPLVLISEVGLLTIADDAQAVPMSDVSFFVNDANELSARVAAVDDKVANAMPYDDDSAAPGNVRLENIIGQPVALSGSEDETAEIEDILLSTDGEPRLAILGKGQGFLNMDQKLVAINFERLKLEQGDGGYYVDLTPQDIREAPAFVYSKPETAQK